MDGSGVAIAAVLIQMQEEAGNMVERPIAYGSKSLSDVETRYGDAPQYMSGFAFFADPNQFERLPDLDEEQAVAHVSRVDMQASQLEWMEPVASPIKLKTWFLTAPVELKTLSNSDLELCQLIRDYAVHKYRVSDLVNAQKLDVLF